MGRRLVLALGLAALLARPAVARADRPASPGRLVEGCRSDPQSSLCREVRRLCATRAVRDEVVPACQELGWYGDSVYREIVNLCPIDPTHVRCEIVKAQCEHDQAALVGDEGEKICRELGWGEYAYTRVPGAAPDGPAAGPVGDDGPGWGAPAAAPVPVERVHTPAASWSAGLEGAGLRVGFVDHAERLGEHETLYMAHLSTTRISFISLPLALVSSGDLGHASGGGILYRLDGLAGLGHWWTPHLASALVAGVGLSGIADTVPFAVDVPVRLVGVAHVGDSLTVQAWAQLEWYGETEDSRRSGSPSVSFADAAELGAALVWGRRVAANSGLGSGLFLGGALQEQNGTRIVSITVGWGTAKNPWNL